MIKKFSAKYFLEKGFFEYIDLAIAMQIGEKLDEYSLFAIAYIMLSARMGHICVKYFDGNISPAPSQLLNGNNAYSKQEENILKEFVTIGLTNLKHNNFINDKIHIDGNNFYLYRLWKYYDYIKKSLEIMLNAEPKISIDYDKLKADIYQNNDLLPEQRDAVVAAAKYSLSIITGGPGTGKSYTVKHIIKTLKTYASKELRIIIAAPTGKAAANLNKAIPEYTSQTLHSLLQLHKKTNNNFYLPVDLLIIDESSMIDAYVMKKLLSQLLPGTRLILIGDPNQLPPVEAGAMFAELVEQSKNNLYHTALKKCMRTECNEIIECANLVRKEDNSLIKKLADNHYNGIVNSTDLNSLDVTQLSHYYEFLNDITTMSSDILTRCNNFRILSPLKSGLWGVDNLNKKIDACLGGVNCCRAIPVMVTRNDYALELANGDTGLLYKQKGKTYFFIEGQEHQQYYNKTLKLRQIPEIVLPEYQHAYAISIHKSQGSEFNEIFIIWPKEAKHFGQQALYTAITRAKKNIILAL